MPENMTPENMTPEFLQMMITTGAQFDCNGKPLYFSVFVNHEKQTIVQLLQPDAPITITSLVLVSICLKPHKIYTAWDIEPLFGTGFAEQMIDAILIYLTKD